MWAIPSRVVVIVSDRRRRWRLLTRFGAVLVESVPHLHRQTAQLLDREPGCVCHQCALTHRPLLQAAAGTGLRQFPDDHRGLLHR